MKMMDQSQFDELTKNQKLEINPNHELIVKLNKIRKDDQDTAIMVAHQLIDSVFMGAGLPVDFNEVSERNYSILSEYLDNRLQKAGIAEDIVIDTEPESEGIMDEAAKMRKTPDEHTVTEDIKVEDLKK